MKITILSSKHELKDEQVKELKKLAKVTFVKDRKEYHLDELIKLCKDAEIIGLDPDITGGFEKSKDIVNKLVNAIPSLKGIALTTTAYGWIDLNHIKSKGIKVTNVPHYSSESVAEHVIALLLCLAKRIIITDRKTQKGKYVLSMGFELKCKTLGIIGLGSIGTRVAELAQGIGMKVIATNPSPRDIPNVEMVSLEELLKQSDAISLNLRDDPKLKNMLSKEEIKKMKDGVIIVNTADRLFIDEDAMAIALKSGKVYGYAYEAEDLENTPLSKCETAIGLKGFGWYTKESIENLFEIFTNNIINLVKGEPSNLV